MVDACHVFGDNKWHPVWSLEKQTFLQSLRDGRAGSGLASCRSAWALHPNLNQMALLLLVPSGTSAGFYFETEICADTSVTPFRHQSGEELDSVAGGAKTSVSCLSQLQRTFSLYLVRSEQQTCSSSVFVSSSSFLLTVSSSSPPSGWWFRL